jgi:hypothetical protein
MASRLSALLNRRCCSASEKSKAHRTLPFTIPVFRPIKSDLPAPTPRGRGGPVRAPEVAALDARDEVRMRLGGRLERGHEHLVDREREVEADEVGQRPVCLAPNSRSSGVMTSHFSLGIETTTPVPKYFESATSSMNSVPSMTCAGAS